MIERVRLKYFKRFTEEEFYLSDRIVLAGPNNSGKSTLLQAIAVWNLAVMRWKLERGDTLSKAERRAGVPITRKGFTAIPLREMNLLWTDRSTAFSKNEREGLKPGSPKYSSVSIEGKEVDGTTWTVGVDLRFSSREQIYVKLVDKEGDAITELPAGVDALEVVYIPPFSGIGAEETRYDRGYQNLLIGQGKPGDILRNLLLEIFQQDREGWEQLKRQIEEIFGYILIDPAYTESDPFIVIEYQESGMRKPFDLASAGGGFHQVLTLFGFLFARKASVLLIDEPDAHEHVILQRQVYDRLQRVAHERNSQLIISTHSEVLMEETSPVKILSFYGRPHRLEVRPERDQIREALKRVSSMDLLFAENRQNILYVEDVSDLKILSEFARVLQHRLTGFFKAPFFHPIKGRDPREARGHFFGLKAIRAEIRAVLLLDRDNRDLPDREVDAEGLTILRWQRYEIENYLLHPEALLRFVRGSEPLFRVDNVEKAELFLSAQLPPDAYTNPLGNNEYLISVAASKRLLPDFFNAAGIPIAKKEYFLIAGEMRPEEIHPEVQEKLDLIADRVRD